MDKQKIITWTLVILGIVGLFAFLVYIVGSGTPAGTLTLTTPVGETDHIRGAATAKVTLVEYSDFQCPACAGYEPILKQVQALYPNDLRIVYRHFPLFQIHEKAMISSQASEAAGLQGKFWEMHDKLFENQEKWVNSKSVEKDFETYAAELGLNAQQFATDMISDAVKNRVQQDFESGTNANIGGTPTFFLNGTQIGPNSLDEFKSLIEAELKK